MAKNLKLGHIPEFEQGNTVNLTSRIRDSDGTHVTPDHENGDYGVSISVKRSEGSDYIVEDEEMERVEGETPAVFEYAWVTTGLETGEYYIIVEATVGGDPVLNRDRVMLTDISEC